MKGEDKLLSLIGNWGKWQMIFCIYIGILTLPTAWPSLNIKFLSAETDFWCSMPPDFEDIELWKNVSSPFILQDGKYVRDSCRVFADPLADHSIDNKTIPCLSWDYDESYFNRTIIQEWDLVCEREHFVKLAQTVYFTGLLLGVFVSGILSDKFGRKTVLVPLFFAMSASGSICAFSNSIELFLFWRFVSGLTTIGVFAVAFVWCMELVGSPWCTIVGIGLEFPWVIGWFLLALFAHLLGDWRYILLITSVPTFATLSAYWILPESPRWLLSVNRKKEAEVTISRILSFNKKPPLPENWSYSNEEKSSDTNRNVCTALESRSLTLKSLILIVNWFTNSFVYYGLTLNSNNIGGGLMLNFLLNGAMEIPAYAIAMWVLLKRGRKLPYVTMIGLAGVFLITTIFIPRNVYHSNWPQVLLALLGKLCITGAFAICYVYTAEIFPTTVRSMGVGCSSLFARLGGIVAPFVGGLDKVINPSFPVFIFGLSAILSGFLACFLPETVNTDLPDTIEESEANPLSLTDGFIGFSKEKKADKPGVR